MYRGPLAALPQAVPCPPGEPGKLKPCKSCSDSGSAESGYGRKFLRRYGFAQRQGVQQEDVFDGQAVVIRRYARAVPATVVLRCQGKGVGKFQGFRRVSHTDRAAVTQEPVAPGRIG